jgi:hypothetical protein
MTKSTVGFFTCQKYPDGQVRKVPKVVAQIVGQCGNAPEIS